LSAFYTFTRVIVRGLNPLHHIIPFGGADGRGTLYPAEMIYAQVMGNPEGPAQKLAFIVIPVLPDGINNFDEYFLKQVFGKVFVLHKEKNTGINPVFIAFDEVFKRYHVAFIK
jgi:hypothetical protein